MISGYYCPAGAVCWKWRMGQIETPSSAPVFFKKNRKCNYVIMDSLAEMIAMM